jgi:hypothetical protein
VGRSGGRPRGTFVYPHERTDLSERPEAVEEFIAAFPDDEQLLLRQRLEHINAPSLADRLRKLTKEADRAFRLVITDTKTWVRTVVDIRRDIAHGNRLAHDGQWLRTLADTIEHLIEVHLLMQLGMSSEQVADALRDTPRTRRIYRRYVNLLPRT